jgi:hypothetical protein
LAWYFRVYCINRPALWQVNSTGLYLAKNFVWRFLIFADRGHLQALKVRDLKLLCLSQLCGLKDKKIKVGFKNEKYDRWWNENVQKISTHQLAINTEFLLAFYKSNSQMRVI